MTGQMCLQLLLVALQASLAEAPCSTCSMVSEPLEGQTEKEMLLEVAKQNILSKLHLRHRPNISHTISKEMLAQALQKLNNTSENSAANRQDNEDSDSGQDYEIISFADIDNTQAHRTILHFRLSADKDKHRKVHHADMWLYLQTSPGKKVTIKGTTSLLTKPTSKGSIQIEVFRSNWYTVPLPIITRSALGQGEEDILLELECSNCQDQPLITNISDAQLPFLVVKACNQRENPRLRRHSTECTSDMDTCCRKDFYVDFFEIGWGDWIISPQGYNMFLCEGRCPIHLARVPGIAASSHTAIFSLIKANKAFPSLSYCCIPTKRRPLTVLYLDIHSTIVKTDIPDMIVESCGCT
ncbi:inhibin beta C chain-like isoform 1-T2 [Discoglossus pictus]